MSGIENKIDLNALSCSHVIKIDFHLQTERQYQQSRNNGTVFGLKGSVTPGETIGVVRTNSVVPFKNG